MRVAWLHRERATCGEGFAKLFSEMTPREYETPKGDPKLGPESARDLAILSDHIAMWWGESPEVFHEIVSEYVHIDLHLVPASGERPYHTVITSGMSDRPMRASEDPDDLHYCELVMALPADWPIKWDDLREGHRWWPFKHLKQTARFPHVNDTFLWYGHTVANENPPARFHPEVPFVGGILSIPILCPKEGWRCRVNPKKEVYFFSFIPLLEPELQFAWKEGSGALFEKMDEAEVDEVIDPSRKSVV